MCNESYINDKYCQPFSISENRAVYKIDELSDCCEIKLFKEDIWKNNYGRLGRIFLVILSADMIFGGLFETENLPFYFDDCNKSDYIKQCFDSVKQ